MTMLLCVASPSAIYLAADSKQSPNGREDVVKIFILGARAAIAISGIALIPLNDEEWDASRETARIVDETSSRPPSEQFAQVCEEIKRSFCRALANYSAKINHPAPKLEVWFIRRFKHHNHFARQEFQVASKQLGSAWDHSVENVKPDVVLDSEDGAGIWWTVPTGCSVTLPKNLPLGDEDRKTITAVFSAASSQCPEQIGGAIRIVAIDDDGAKWR